jgi:hypothetical protein
MWMPVLLADVIGGPVFVLAGGIAALILLAAVVIIETPVLVLMHWQPFLYSLRDAVIVNLVSMAVGFVMVQVLFPFDLITMVVISWLLSIIVEGGVLMLLRSESAQRSFLASLAMNTASYVVVALLIAVFEMPR